MTTETMSGLSCVYETNLVCQQIILPAVVSMNQTSEYIETSRIISLVANDINTSILLFALIIKFFRNFSRSCCMDSGHSRWMRRASFDGLPLEHAKREFLNYIEMVNTEAVETENDINSQNERIDVLHKRF